MAHRPPIPHPKPVRHPTYLRQAQRQHGAAATVGERLRLRVRVRVRVSTVGERLRVRVSGERWPASAAVLEGRVEGGVEGGVATHAPPSVALSRRRRGLLRLSFGLRFESGLGFGRGFGSSRL